MASNDGVLSFRIGDGASAMLEADTETRILRSWTGQFLRSVSGKTELLSIGVFASCVVEALMIRTKRLGVGRCDNQNSHDS